MIFRLMLKGLCHGKARFLCAVAGIAVAVGSVVFTSSLVATNDLQAPVLAKRASAPWAAWKVDGIQLRGRRGMPPAVRGNSALESSGGRRRQHRIPGADLEMPLLQLTIDYRPGGHVMQGPPMMALMAAAPGENPYPQVKLVEGRWVDAASSTCEVVAVRNSLKRFGKEAPPLGCELKFVGRKGTMSARVVGYLDGGKLPASFPYVFANRAAFAGFAEETRGSISFWKTAPIVSPETKLLTPESEEVIAAFKGDEQRRMDYARPLMLVASVLTALALLVNSLLLSVESNRPVFAVLRTIGMTRLGAVTFVMEESLFASVVGWLVGVVAAVGMLTAYVAADAIAFPVGATLDCSAMRLTFVVLLVVAIVAVLFALRPALSVRPMDSAAVRSRTRCRGMAITFACGFAAFVAVEVWGASLMRAFVPSGEWPDAIVSILPSGVSSFDIEKLRTVEGVKRISELYPLQMDIAGAPAGHMGVPNALFLAAEWLPCFRFLEGSWEDADKAIHSSDACVITEMMSRAHNLHKGDMLRVVPSRRGGGGEVALPVTAVVDLNWHMVTSRGLVRGLNGASGMTDGPVFVSFDTLESIDPRPAFMVRMTHLWVEYEEKFLARHGVFQAGRLVERAIAERLGNPVESTVRLHARDEIADGTLAHGSDVIGQAARVPFVFLFVLSVGFVAMLVARADALKREFAVLRAVGATRFQLVCRLASSAVVTALIGIACGVPTGSLLGWLFSLKTGSWPGLPHYFVLPVQVVCEGAVGAIVFALVFAVPAAVFLVNRVTRGGMR